MAYSLKKGYYLADFQNAFWRYLRFDRHTATRLAVQAFFRRTKRHTLALVADGKDKNGVKPGIVALWRPFQ